MNEDERLKRQIQSNATLSKRWDRKPYSATVNLNYREDLASGESVASLPQVSFVRNSSPVLPQPEGAGVDEANWWNKLMYSYRFSGVNRRSIRVQREVSYETVEDSTILVERETKTTRYRSGVRHTMGLSAAAASVGYFSLTPRISYNEDWFDEWLEFRPGAGGGVDTVKHKGFKARRTFSGSISLSTRLYGLFNPKLFGLEALRHTLSPQLSFTYRPDFAKPFWGYYDVFTDADGRERFYDRFAGNVYGGTPRGRQEALGIGVNNLFEYKIKKGDREIKGELFNLSLSTSHNFAADSLKWGNLTSSMRFHPFGAAGAAGAAARFSGLALDLRGTHSFYAQQLDPRTRSFVVINESAPGLLRLVRFEISTNFSIEGGAARPGTAGVPTDTTERLQPSFDRFEPKEWTPSPVPWQASISLRYSVSRDNPLSVRKDCWGSLNLNLQATKNWKVSYTTRLDLMNRQTVSTNISLYRDLHCWEGRLVWNPTGVGKGLYLKINVKSPQLKDIKIEKREGGGGFLGL